jgi:hypothetical protein
MQHQLLQPEWKSDDRLAPRIPQGFLQEGYTPPLQGQPFEHCMHRVEQ